MLKAVVFDMDDTLYPERDYVRSGFHAAGEWLQEHHGRAGLFACAEACFEEGLRGRIFNAALERLGVTASEELVGQLVAVYREHLPRIQLFPDADRAIRRLEYRYSLAIITDGYHAVQRKKVEALELRSRIPCIVYSDAFGRANWKPSPIPYLKVMEELRVTGSECMYIGDNYAKDFAAANELGWSTVCVERAGRIHEAAPVSPAFQASRVISTLDELYPMLEEESIG